MNLPNKLTILRIILVPVMVLIPFLNIKGELLNIPLEYIYINLIFILACLTDRLDGHLARKNNEVTTFGKFADPLADKILVLSAMLMLVESQRLPAWIPIIVVFREFVVSGYRLIAVEKGGKVIPANIWGKIKTVTQMIGIILMYLNTYSYFECLNNPMISFDIFYLINLIGSITILISVIATIFSGWTYIKNGKDLLFDKEKN